LLIVALLIYVVHASKEAVTWSTRPPYLMVWTLACIVVLLIQTLFGTELREVVDQLAVALPRKAWISNAGAAFTLHRSFSWVVLVLHAGLIFNLYMIPEVKRLRTLLLSIISITFLSGLGMAYFSVPAALQPVHLLMATAAFGIQVFLLLQAKDSRQRLAAA
jgi:cytochrome c oxidase assembly protein subunit 15